MSTYNGEKYIVEQMDSLRDQTREIDEVLIYDDVSKDNTVSLIKKYISENNLDNWQLNINSHNLGWEKNFSQGIQKAKGDIIFTCDQDDIWHLDKIEKMTIAFEDNPDIVLLASNYHSFGSSKNCSMPIKLEYSFSKNGISKVKFNNHYYWNVRPGCVMAFSKKVMVPVYKILCGESPHDSILWTIATLMQGYYIIDEPLIEYRRTGNAFSNSSHGFHHNYKYIVDLIKRTYRINNWYLNSEFYDKKMSNIVKDCSEWCKLRYDLICNGKLKSWFKVFKYKNYYITKKQYFGDLYYFLHYIMNKNN